MTYPLNGDPQPYAGLWPGPAAWNTWGSRRFWLGTPGAMYQLSDPGADGYSGTRSRGKIVKGLQDGSQSMSQYARANRSWSFSWLRLPPADRAVIEALDAGRLGTPPFVFLPPDDTNRLTESQSYADATAWGVTAGVLSQATVTGPVPGCGVLSWDANAAGDLLKASTVAGATLTPQTDSAVPYVPAEPLLVAFSVWCPSGTASVRAVVSGVGGDGTVSATVNGNDTTVGTTPRAVYVPVAVDGLSGAYVMPQLRSNDGLPVYVSTPQLTLTTDLQAWLPGQGAPRVSIISELAWAVDANQNSAGQITLAEANTKAL